MGRVEKWNTFFLSFHCLSHGVHFWLTIAHLSFHLLLLLCLDSERINCWCCEQFFLLLCGPLACASEREREFTNMRNIFPSQYKIYSNFILVVRGMLLSGCNVDMFVVWKRGKKLRRKAVECNSGSDGWASEDSQEIFSFLLLLLALSGVCDRIVFFLLSSPLFSFIQLSNLIGTADLAAIREPFMLRWACSALSPLSLPCLLFLYFWEKWAVCSRRNLLLKWMQMSEESQISWLNFAFFFTGAHFANIFHFSLSLSTKCTRWPRWSAEAIYHKSHGRWGTE